MSPTIRAAIRSAHKYGFYGCSLFMSANPGASLEALKAGVEQSWEQMLTEIEPEQKLQSSESPAPPRQSES